MPETGIPLSSLAPSWLSDDAGVYGIEFDCPCGCRTRIYTCFVNPISGPPTNDARCDSPRWARMGDRFETITLAPAIYAMDHWHGWMRDGRLIPDSYWGVDTGARRR